MTDLFLAALAAFLGGVFIGGVLAFLGVKKLTQAKMMSVMFSWPQGVTAVIGTALALLVVRYYREAKV